MIVPMNNLLDISVIAPSIGAFNIYVDKSWSIKLWMTEGDTIESNGSTSPVTSNSIGFFLI